MTVIVSTSFDGTSGDPWPSPWTSSLAKNVSGGAVDLQANRGRMRGNDGSYSVARSIATGTSGTDVRWTGTVRFESSAESYAFLWARSSGTWSTTDASNQWVQTTGYTVAFFPAGTSGRILIRKSVGGVEVPPSSGVAESPFTFAAGTDYRFKVELEGTAIRARIWLASDSEPATWAVTATDADYASGAVAASFVTGPTGVGREVRWDDFLATSLADSEASEWTGWIETVTDPPPGGSVRLARSGSAWVATDRLVRRGGSWA